VTDRERTLATLASAARVLAAVRAARETDAGHHQEYVTTVGYPEPDRGPLQVLHSPGSIRLNPQQEARDRSGLRSTCAACGNAETARDPLVVADGYRIHVSHARDEDSGYYGVAFQQVAS
jgi:hypothetical protein